ncbi:hypothetical protein MRX96_024550 [Rhipicephalus microplus]
MGKNKLFCVLGEYVQYYNDVNIDGLCDYAFFTFYGKHDVAFKVRHSTCPGDFYPNWKDLQGKFKKAHPDPPSPPRGFIALGVRVWPANMVPFLCCYRRRI